MTQSSEYAAELERLETAVNQSHEDYYNSTTELTPDLKKSRYEACLKSRRELAIFDRQQGHPR